MKTIILLFALLELITAVAILPLAPLGVLLKPHYTIPVLHFGAPLYGYSYALSPSAVHLYIPGNAVVTKVVPPVIGKDLYIPVIKDVPLYGRKGVIVPVGKDGFDIVPKKDGKEDGKADGKRDKDDDDKEDKEELREKEALIQKITVAEDFKY